MYRFCNLTIIDRQLDTGYLCGRSTVYRTHIQYISILYSAAIIDIVLSRMKDHCRHRDIDIDRTIHS